jgi:muramidase (phage lysozyme)
MEISPNAQRWLNAISAAEGTMRDGKRGYNIMFGGGTFPSYERHPDTVIHGGRLSSAAAGAYQFMPGTYGIVKRDLKLPDFSPSSQDQAALELIRRRGVDPDRDPLTPENVNKLSPEWAAFPTLQGRSYYPKQTARSFQFVKDAFNSPLKAQGPRAQQAALEKPPEVAQQPVSPSQSQVPQEETSIGNEEAAALILIGELKAKLNQQTADFERAEKTRAENDEKFKNEVLTKMKEGYAKNEEIAKVDALTEMFMESERARANERAAEAKARRREAMSKALDPSAQLAYLNAAAEAQRSKFKPGESVI